ncbi:MAG: CvpA family protein [Mycoplasmatota bacterium]|nr:CvpA family protein [Mycoplasmatota bacterium]
MNITIVDAIILLIILLGGVIGFKEGVIKELTSIIGLVIVVIVSFSLKNYLSVLFYENLPFFNFWGIFKGIQVLNIVFYEMLAFIIIASLLTVVYRILLSITGLIEKILKATIILSIPSKILGFIVGLIEYYIWVYIVLFILTLPVINLKSIYESKTANFIMEKTPFLSKYTEKTLKIYNDLYEIIDNRENKTNEKVNEEAMNLMLKHEIITKKSAKKLIDSNKVLVEDEHFLDNYN